MANFTFDQIANYLTDGYAAANNETPSMFDLSVDRVLSYDISRLSAQAQLIAEQAFDVWSAVTGITFVSEGVTGVALTETTDAGLLNATTYTISTNTEISGNISSGTDEDHYRVTLTAGETYLVGLSNYPGGTLGDAVLQLLDSTGNELASADSVDVAAGEYVTFTAATTGTYYIAASGFEDTFGTYGLSIQTAADITFGDMDQTGAYAFSESTNNLVDHSYINIADNWDALNLNGYMLQTYIHEIGHSLGLGHAGNYNGSAAWGVDNHYDNDSWSATVMSYFNQQQNPNDPGSFAYLLTFMPADIIAIQNIYGAGPTGFATGNTIWGEGGNVVMGSFQDMLDRAIANDTSDPFLYNGQPIAFTIYDTGGTDTINSSSSTVSQTINLNELTYSSLFGETGNVAIARGTVIENAVGGSGIDVMTGNAVANTLQGFDGDDTINGGAGGDVLDGGANGVGGDTVDYTGSTNGVIIDLHLSTAAGGHATGDVISGFENVKGTVGLDIIVGDANANVLDGAGGVTDTLHYIHSNVGVNVNLKTNVVSGGHATGDTILNFERVTGSSHADTLRGSLIDNLINGGSGDDLIYGDAGVDTLNGNNGNDTIFGGLGADIINGGGGSDTISFVASLAGVNVNLLLGTGTGGEAQGDTYALIESFAGSNHADVFIGGNAATARIEGLSGTDTLTGGSGADTFVGGVGGDTMNGLGGIDRANYSASTAVTINLLTNTHSGGEAAGDSLINIEEVSGSAFGDVITGDTQKNHLLGQAGADRLDGGVGADTLTGGTGSDSFVFNFNQSGTTATTHDFIADYAKGAVGVGDEIDAGVNLLVGGAGAVLSSSQATINAAGKATFFAGSGTTLADALNDISSAISVGGTTAGEFAFFQVGGTGAMHMFISDAVAGVGAGDVLVRLTGITTVNSIDITAGDVTILT